VGELAHALFEECVSIVNGEPDNVGPGIRKSGLITRLIKNFGGSPPRESNNNTGEKESKSSEKIKDGEQV